MRKSEIQTEYIHTLKQWFLKHWFWLFSCTLQDWLCQIFVCNFTIWNVNIRSAVLHRLRSRINKNFYEKANKQKKMEISKRILNWNENSTSNIIEDKMKCLSDYKLALAFDEWRKRTSTWFAWKERTHTLSKRLR